VQRLKVLAPAMFFLTKLEPENCQVGANLFHGRVLAIRMYVDARVIFLSGFGLVCLCNRCFQCILGRMLVYSIHSTSSGTLWRGVLRFRPCKSHQCTCYRVKLAPGRVLAIRSYVDALVIYFPGCGLVTTSFGVLCFLFEGAGRRSQDVHVAPM
jgi:hypothetical protein